MKILKRTSSFILIMSMLCILLSVCTYAAEPGISVSGASAVRAGDTVKLTFKMSGNKTYGAQFSLSFDTSLVTYSKSEALLSGWLLETNNDGSNGKMNFLFYDNNQKTPINDSKNAFTVTFKVKSSAKTGAEIKITASNVLISYTNSAGEEVDSSSKSASYSVKVAAPLSTDCKLSELSIDGIDISPKFSASETDYTATVDHTVNSVKITAKANDSKAKVSVSGGDNLKTGKNTVKITVKAEDGSTKSYEIVITKKEDPNREQNADSTLKSLEPSEGILSPAFSPDITDYIIYLPYEIENIKLDGTHNDPRGSSQDAEGSLNVGKNEFTVIGTAENGDTTEYKVTVMRMPPMDETTDTSEETAADTTTDADVITDTVTTAPDGDLTSADTTAIPVDSETTAEADVTTSPETTVSDGSSITMSTGVPLWIVVIIAVTALLLGAGCGMLVFKR